MALRRIGNASGFVIENLSTSKAIGHYTLSLVSLHLDRNSKRRSSGSILSADTSDKEECPLRCLNVSSLLRACPYRTPQERLDELIDVLLEIRIFPALERLAAHSVLLVCLPQPQNDRRSRKC